MSGFDAAKDEILEWLCETLQLPVDQIDLNKPLTEIGLDSLDAVHMIATIESIIRQELPEDIIKKVTSLNDIFELMRERMAAA